MARHTDEDLLHRFRVKPGRDVDLAAIDPGDVSAFGDEALVRAQLSEDAAAINVLQDRLYAEGRRSLLVVLQGTDTSGKDGTIRHVFNATGPLGVTVTAFRRPSELELAHDFLWRVHLACPRRGTISIFNRSHYEDVLVPRARGSLPKEVIEQRYGQINGFERMLVENGTTILKFMLHISKKEQGKRLQERLDKPSKRWKFDPGDLEDRKHWDRFQDAYRSMLHHTSTEWAPWCVIPADRKWARNAAVARIVLQTLEQMDPQYPAVSWQPGQFSVE